MGKATKKAPEENAAGDENDFVRFELFLIFGDKGDISEVFFQPQLLNCVRGTCVKLIPAQRKLFCRHVASKMDCCALSRLKMLPKIMPLVNEATSLSTLIL